MQGGVVVRSVTSAVLRNGEFVISLLEGQDPSTAASASSDDSSDED